MKRLFIKVYVLCEIPILGDRIRGMTQIASVPAPQYMSREQFTADLRTVFSRLLNEKEEQIKIEFID